MSVNYVVKMCIILELKKVISILMFEKNLKMCIFSHARFSLMLIVIKNKLKCSHLKDPEGFHVNLLTHVAGQNLSEMILNNKELDI